MRCLSKGPTDAGNFVTTAELSHLEKAAAAAAAAAAAEEAEWLESAGRGGGIPAPLTEEEKYGPHDEWCECGLWRSSLSGRLPLPVVCSMRCRAIADGRLEDWPSLTRRRAAMASHLSSMTLPPSPHLWQHSKSRCSRQRAGLRK